MKIPLKKIPCFVCILLIIYFPAVTYAQLHGLMFSSYEAVQEKRTSLDLGAGAPICLTNNFDLSFDLSFVPDHATYFGYIFRLINNRNQNIDLVYSEKNDVFIVIFGDARANINFQISRDILLNKWSRITLRVKEGELALLVDGHLINKGKADIRDYCFKIVFGACNFHDFKSTDLPPMQLRNVRIAVGNQLKYYWPLKESTGTTCLDSVRHAKGTVANPVWIAPLHYQWQLLHAAKVSGNASIAFDGVKEELYVIARDSVHRFSVKNGSSTGIRLTSAQHHLSLGNQSFFHPEEARLYNFFIDQRRMAAFDPARQQWDHPFDSADVTEYWHANKFYSPSQDALYILGGYGQLKYKNKIECYRFATHTWEDLPAGGDHFTPRYLAALGTTSSGDTAYVIGGYGSMTGEQIVNPKYLYDLLLFDAKKQSFKKLYTLKAPETSFVFANSMVIDTGNASFYALTFPNDRFDSRLQLVRGSLTTPSYVPVGDTIPYDFQDTRSFADLFFCPSSKKLLAVTLLTDKNRETVVKLYTIAFPPNELLLTATTEVPGKLGGLLFGALVLVIAGYIFFMIPRWREQSALSPKPASVPVSANEPDQESKTEDDLIVQQEAPAILLFGNFKVTDREGQDVSHLFTPLLKEMFLLIVIYTVKYKHGISVENLNEILWNDKSDKAARNNRSVNMVKLKSILEKLGNCVFKKESGNWVFQYEKDEIRIDLSDLLPLLDDRHGMDREKIRQLLNIVNRGAFLYQTDYPWLDDIKSDLSNKVLDILIFASTTLSSPADAELLIEIANSIFHFDQVNEQALRLKCKNLVLLGRHSLAKNTYEKFAREYRHMYAEDFSDSFNSIISD